MAADLLIRIGVDGEEVQRAVRKSLRQFQRFAKDLQKLGREMTKAFTVPIAGIATAAFASSERAMLAFDKFHQNLKGSFGRLGDEIAEAINLEDLLFKFSSAFESLVDWFSKLDDSTKEWIVTVGAFVAVAGPALVVLNSIAGTIASLAVLLTGPVGIVLGVGALAAGVVALGVAFGNAEEEQDEFNARLEETAQKLELQARFPELAAKIAENTARMGEVMHDYTGHVFEATEETIKLYGATARLTQTLGEAAAAARALEWDVATDRLRELEKQSLASKVQAEALGGGVNLVDAEIQNLAQQYAVWQGIGMKEDMARVRGEIEALQTPLQTFIGQLQALPPIGVQVGNALFSAFQTAADGIGQVLAELLVHGESFAEGMSAVLDRVAMQLIASNTKAFIDLIAINLTEIITGSVAAHAKIPFVGIALGLAAAAAGIAGSRALAKRHGGREFAEGGLVTGPVLGLVGEAGPEVVTPLDRFERMVGRGRGRERPIELHAHFHADGRELTELVLRNTPKVLRFHGVT